MSNFKTFLSFFCILSFSANSTHETRYKEGEALAGGMKADIRASQLIDIPNYGSDKPAETGFYEDSESISSAATAKLRTSSTNEAGNLLLETQAKRKYFDLNPNTDPLFIQANSIVANPEEALKVGVEDGASQQPTKELHTCYEARGVETHRCTLRRVVKLRPIEEKKHLITITGHGHGFWYRNKGKQHWGHDHIPFINAFDLEFRKSHSHSYINIDSALPFPRELATTMTRSILVVGSIQMDSDYNISHPNPSGHCGPFSGSVEIVYKPNPTEADLIETIEDSCAGFESATEAGTCRYGTETIVEGPATKTLDGLAVTRDWWHLDRTYICNYPSKNDCEPLRARGCFQTNSKCHKELDGRCVEFEQTYACVKYPASHAKATTTGEAPFCLTGDCSNQSWNPNQDMAEVMAKLSMLKELKKEIDVTKAGKIFHGTAMSCSKHCISFSDCCGLSSGWGEDLGLTRCSEGERLLSKKRQEHKCHQVGTYCAEKTKVGGICTKKKTVFCCFESKLARIIHEQGRGQLGISWGETVKEKDKPDRIHPNCRALTIEEFSRIDFKRINFSEIFSDVWSKIKVPDAGKVLDQFQTDWGRRLPTASELKASKLSESSEIKNKISERRAQAASSLTPGAYSLNSNPPPRAEREEEQAEVVF